MPDNYTPNQQQTRAMPQHAQPYQQQQYQQRQYQQQYQQMPPQQFQRMPQSFMPESKPTGTGSWFITLFLAGIPLIGLILMFVWAFGSNTEQSKQNWARANLIWYLIAVLIVVGLSVAVVFFGVQLPPELYQYVVQVQS